jgi:hypothetical protein
LIPITTFIHNHYNKLEIFILWIPILISLCYIEKNVKYWHSILILKINHDQNLNL